MTKTVVVANESGSVGKTTCVVNLACAAAARGRTVWVTDVDGQADASYHFGHTRPKLVMGDVLTGRKMIRISGEPGDDDPENFRAPTMRDIAVPAYRETPELAKSEGGIFTDDPKAVEWLRRITIFPSGKSRSPGGPTMYDDTAELNKSGWGGMALGNAVRGNTMPPPDLHIIDTHGTKSIVMMSALAVADKIITCVLPDKKSTGKHLNELIKTIGEVKAVAGRDQLDLDAIIPCRVRPANHGKFYRLKIEAVEQKYQEKVTPRIYEAVSAGEAYEAKEPLLLWVPDTRVTDEYFDVLKWLDEHGVTQ